jgi:hypothetical protein
MSLLKTIFDRNMVLKNKKKNFRTMRVSIKDPLPLSEKSVFQEIVEAPDLEKTFSKTGI